MKNGISVRPVRDGEENHLEALQWRASLSRAGDRSALPANPDAIVSPLHQITPGLVFVAERSGKVSSFAALLYREDGQIDFVGFSSSL
jgi:hypothetical protein